MARERTERLGERAPRTETAQVEAPTDARPRDIGELLDLSVEVLVENFGRLFGLSFLVLVLSQGMLFFLEEVAPDEDASLGALLGAGVLGLALQTVATAIIGVLAIRVTLRAVLGDALPTRSMGVAVPMAVLVSVITTAIVFAVGVVTLFLGAIVLMYKFLYAPVLVVTEKVGPLAAMRRSWELTRSSFGRCASVLIGATLMLLPLHTAALAVTEERGYTWVLERLPAMSSEAATIVLLLIAALLSALPTALLGVVRAVLYADTLIRREGIDLEAGLSWRRAQLDREPPPTSEPVEELI